MTARLPYHFGTTTRQRQRVENCLAVLGTTSAFQRKLGTRSIAWITVASLSAIVLPDSLKAEDTTAETNRYCSRGFDHPAILTFDSKGGFILEIGSQTEHYRHGGSVGTGLNGMVYSSDSKPDVQEAVRYTTILLDANYPDRKVEPEILILGDRVFWPCDIVKSISPREIE